MPKIVKPLTKTQVSNAKPKHKVYSLNDGQGLSLRVTPAGMKSWVYRYSKPSGGITNWAFAEYPATGIEDARLNRAEFRKQLSQGKDPQIMQKLIVSAAQATFAEIVEKWLELKATKVSDDYLDDVKRSLEMHVLPEMGPVPVTMVTAPLAIDTLRPLQAAGKFETLKRCCIRINEAMTYAVNTGAIETNNLTGIATAFAAPEVKNQPTIPPEELPGLMQAVANASISRTTRNLILFQLHTMTRPAEAATARWEDIDLDAKQWSIPAERMKRKMPHVVPLSDAVVALLKRQEDIAGNSPWVFPAARNKTKHMNSQTANMALKRMGYKDQLVSHGLRRIAATACVDAGGFDDGLVDRCLSHISGSVDTTKSFNAYSKATYLDQRVEVMTWWSKFITDARAKALAEEQAA